MLSLTEAHITHARPFRLNTDLVQPAKEFVVQSRQPVVNVDEVVPVVRDFLDDMAQRFETHELWKVRHCTRWLHSPWPG